MSDCLHQCGGVRVHLWARVPNLPLLPRGRRKFCASLRLSRAAFSRDREESATHSAYLASETLDAVVARINRAHWESGRHVRRTAAAALLQSNLTRYQHTAVTTDPGSSPHAVGAPPVQVLSSPQKAARSTLPPMSWDYEVETTSLIANSAALKSLSASVQVTEATVIIPIPPTFPSTSSTDTYEPVVPGLHIDHSWSSNPAVVPGASDNWLDAVLSVPTSRLSSDTDEAIIHSLNRLASLRYAPVGEQLQELLDGVRWRFSSFQLQHFESLAANLAQLGHCPAQDWWDAFERSSLHLIRGGSPRLLSRTLQSLAQLGYTPSPSWLNPTLEEIRLNPARMSLHSWASALSALAQMRRVPEQHWLLAFFSSSSDRLADATATVLTSLIWSLSKLQPLLATEQQAVVGVPDGGSSSSSSSGSSSDVSSSSRSYCFAWMEEYATAAAALAREGSYSQNQLSVSICAAAAAAEGFRGKSSSAGSSSSNTGSSSSDDSPAMPLLSLISVLVDAATLQLHLMHPADISSILCALGRLGFNPPSACLSPFLSSLQEQLPRLTPSQLCSLSWAVAKLPSSSVSPSFVHTLQLDLAAQMPGLPAGGVGKVLWALAKLHAQPCRKFTVTLWEVLEKRCGSMSSSELSLVLWSLSKLQLQPKGQWLEEVLSHGQEGLEGVTVREAAQMTCGLAGLGYEPPTEWFVALECATLPNLKEAAFQELVNLHCGLAQLGHSPCPAWESSCIRELQQRCAGNGHQLSSEEVKALLHEALLASTVHCKAH